MNDLTDDILSDLADLESSTEDLTEQTSHAKSAQKKLASSSSAQSIDATSLALEAAKAAQDAARQSQHAAESAIKLSNDFKAQIIELSDSNASWRQTARTASHDIEKNRNAMIVMMSATVALGVITTGLSAWFLHLNSKKQEMFKGEVLDLIQTENTLNNKSITLKVDQISSLIEVLSADIQKLNTLGIAQNPASLGTTHAPVNIHTIEEGTDEHPTDENPAKSSNQDNHETQTVQHSMQETQLQDSPESTASIAIHTDALTELKNLINLILDKQQNLEAAVMVQYQTLKQTQKTVQSPIVSKNNAISEKQIKQLDGIGWLIRKQEKMLKEIQESIRHSTQNTNNQTTQNGIEGIEKSLNELKAQIFSLSMQQKAIEAQVTELQAQTQKLSEVPKPYSYQVR